MGCSLMLVRRGKKKLSLFGPPPAWLNQKTKKTGQNDGPAGKCISFASKMASIRLISTGECVVFGGTKTTLTILNHGNLPKNATPTQRNSWPYDQGL